MFQLPESIEKLRLLRMGIALFICASCFVLGLPFMSYAHTQVAALPSPILSSSMHTIVRAALPGVLGSFLWSVAAAFLLFTLIKIQFKNKEKHLQKVFFVHRVGLAFLWLTVPISAIWLVAVLLGGS